MHICLSEIVLECIYFLIIVITKKKIIPAFSEGVVPFDMGKTDSLIKFEILVASVGCPCSHTLLLLLCKQRSREMNLELVGLNLEAPFCH